MDNKEELIQDIERVKEMIDSQLALIERLKEEVIKGQIVLTHLKELKDKEMI